MTQSHLILLLCCRNRETDPQRGSVTSLSQKDQRMFALDLCSYLSQNYEMPYMEPPQISSSLLQGHSTSISSVMAS